MTDARPILVPRTSAIALLLVLTVVGAYWRVVACGFTAWDDEGNLAKNPDFNPVTLRSVAAYWNPRHHVRGLYVPLTYTVWGLAACVPGTGVETAGNPPLNPHAYHLANLLIHTLATLAAFAFLRAVISILVRNKREADWPAAAGALLFALHPVQVESVAWVSGTKDLLWGLFGITALWQYVRHAALRHGETLASRPGQPMQASQFSRIDRHGDGRAETRFDPHYLLAFVSFALALFSKPTAVVLPVAMGAVALLIVRRPFNRTAMELLPFFAFSALFVILNRTPQQEGQVDLIGLQYRPFVAGDAISFYLWKLLVPARFGMHYGRTPSFWLAQPWRYVTGLLPYGLLLLTVVLYLRASAVQEWPRWALAAAVLFTAGVLPVLGFTVFMYQQLSTVADHYLYFSMLGPTMILGFVLLRWKSRLAWAAALAALALLGKKSNAETRNWQDSRALFSHALAVNPDSWLAYNGLSVLALQEGDIRQAFDLCKEAIRINPRDPKVLANYGTTLSKLGCHDEAIAASAQAVRYMPDDPDFLCNNAVILAEAGRYDEAVTNLQKTLAHEPRYSQAFYVWGGCLREKGAYSEAIEKYREALRIDPCQSMAHNDIGLCLANLGRIEEAIRSFQAAIRLDSRNAPAHSNLGSALLLHGNPSAARQCCEESMRIDPSSVNTHYNLGLIYDRLGEHSKAIEQFEEVLRLQPEHPAAARALKELRAKQPR